MFGRSADAQQVLFFPLKFVYSGVGAFRQSLNPMIGTTADGYKIIRLLGEGGMGQVYDAIEERSGRRVALKTLRAELASDGEMLARFRSEARALSTVNSIGLVKIYGTGSLPNGCAYIAMEFVDGSSLRQMLVAHTLSQQQHLHIARLVAETLTTVHSHKIVHRDLKPDNIMIVSGQTDQAEPAIKLLDFGIAKLSTVTEVQTQIVTRTGVIFGTPVYMAPEQCGGEGDICDRTDVYAMGIMLYEQLSGHPPFTGEVDSQILGKHLFSQPPPLRQAAPQVSSDLELLVHAMLAKRPGDRPSMETIASALATLAEGKRLSASHTRVLQFAREAATVRHVQQAGRSASGLSPRVLALAALLFILVGGALAFLLPGRQPPPALGSAQPAVQIAWRVTSTPSGARLLDKATNGYIGKTPYLVTRTPEAGESAVVVELDGFQPQELALHRDRSEVRDVMLAPLAPPEKAESAPRGAGKPANMQKNSGKSAAKVSAKVTAAKPAQPEAAHPPERPVEKRPANVNVPLF